jgi:hypothetical protein
MSASGVVIVFLLATIQLNLFAGAAIPGIKPVFLNHIAQRLFS